MELPWDFNGTSRGPCGPLMTQFLICTIDSVQENPEAPLCFCTERETWIAVSWADQKGSEDQNGAENKPKMRGTGPVNFGKKGRYVHGRGNIDPLV